jgi:PPM family protein phosphatase
MTTWNYASSTDVGLVRELNEDSLHVDDVLAVVADGMGGHAAGEVASEIAVHEIVRAFALDNTKQGLARAVASANQAIILDANEHPERIGMGTTVVALGLANSPAGVVPVVINVGDSRAYQLRDGALRQISLDHSVAEEWVRQGRLTHEEAAVDPRRHQLTRTLGLERDLVPDIFPLSVDEGDRILLCSDGLSNELTDDEIASLASAPHSLEEAVASLISTANRHGGHDNITAILVEFTQPLAAPPPAFEATNRTPWAVEEPTGPVEVVAAEPTGDVQLVKAKKVRRARPRFTWRTAVFLLALVTVIASAYGVLYWYERSSYFLAPHDGRVAIYQGQSQKFLWFKPTFVEVTSVPIKQLQPEDKALLLLTISEPTIAIAKAQVVALHRRWLISQPPPAVTTTTTTTFVE